ncbi:MAG: phosphate ABC transporter permease subunit PstC [Rhodospirillales bacterium]|nr:phosphate ABC transporter permease subunit PstC [Rhodospirillales bacterium]
MQNFLLIVALLVFTSIAFRLGRARALQSVSGVQQALHSRPHYYGVYVAIWCGVPALILALLWFGFERQVTEAILVASLPENLRSLPIERLGLILNDIRNTADGNITSTSPDPVVASATEQLLSLRHIAFSAVAVVIAAVSMIGLILSYRRIAPRMRARNSVETALRAFLVISSTFAILTTVGIVLSLIFESIRFFEKVPALDFIFGLEWSPQTALRKDQVGSSGLFGAVPLFTGTLLISFIAMCVAAPIGLLSAIYMAEYAPRRIRNIVKPLLEILAGIPTVVYGFFAALTVAPLFRNAGETFGVDISSESALAAGVVMGVMIIPLVSSLSDDAITAVPRAMREGSFGLGATRSETIKRVVIPAALPGIIGGMLLAVSRAIGETMIVVMAAGLAANLTANPFEAVTTVTVQIVTLLVGDQEFDSAKTLAAFALGLMLFFVTLGLNAIALWVVNKYREQYE